MRLTTRTRPPDGRTSVGALRSARAAPPPGRGRLVDAAARPRRGAGGAGARHVVDEGHRWARSTARMPSRMPCSSGVAVLDQSGDLERLEPERLPLDPAGEQQRPGDAEPAGDPEVDEQVRHGVAEVLEPARARPARPRPRRRSPPVVVADRRRLRQGSAGALPGRRPTTGPRRRPSPAGERRRARASSRRAPGGGAGPSTEVASE